MDNFKYIYEELKDVEKLINSDMKADYKCKSTNLEMPQAYKSVFTSLFKENNGIFKPNYINIIIQSLV